jgi:non-canonical purine NTP pyrophosphatase (RdgB/HAM1 family)
MESLTYVTGNKGKYMNVSDKFKRHGISIKHFDYDLSEPDVNDIEYISRAKVLEAYDQVMGPVFVTDAGFYIEDYPGNPGYPGAFAKRSGISSNVENLLEVMKDVKDRDCYFLDCLTFYDGEIMKQFKGISRGTLSYEMRGNDLDNKLSNLWYVFIPLNHSKTLAEMSDEERRNRHDNRTSASDEFIWWYLNEYKKGIKLELKK